MTTQESIKPLVDRILSNPLQFNAAMISKKSKNNNGTTAAPQNSSYIVIGKQHNNSSTGGTTTATTNGDQAQPNASMEEPKKNKKPDAAPKSMAEALLLYTSKNSNRDDNVTAVKRPAELSTELSTEPPTSASASEDDNEDEKEEEDHEDEEEREVFHEARDYLEPENAHVKENEDDNDDEDTGEDVGEDIGEDIGLPIATIDGEKEKDTLSGANEVDDDDEDMDYDSTAMEKELPDEGESDSSSTISEDEKKDLHKDLVEANTENVNQSETQNNEAEASQKEEQEHEQEEEEELKHKPRSVTPPTTISDLSNFYQFNENINDHGSLNSSRIIKNWGDQFTNLKPRGLLNHGVTCYTNAAVQAMLHIPSIQHYLFDILLGKYDSTISKSSVSYTLAETSKKMWSPISKNPKKSPSASYINPKYLISRLDDINCMMSEWQQEDSHEYFMSLMSRLQEDSVPKGHKLIESIIYDVFGGLLKQIVTCKSCGSISKTEQPFYDLSLHLKGKKKLDSNSDLLDGSHSSASTASSATNTTTAQSSASSVAPNSNNIGPDTAASNLSSVNRRFSIEKSIRDFFNPELIKVDKEQKGYVCEKCHKTTNAVKHNSILRAPETLLVHLKKFRFNGTSSSKMKQAVSYPMFLDLTEYCDDKDLPVKYQLLSVVVHEGRSLSSGHYIAHCKQPDGTWATYDDEYINKISERDVLKEPNAYYLLYTRLTPKVISLPLAKSTTTAENITSTKSKQEQASSESNKRPLKINNKKNNRKKWKKNKKRKFSK